MVAARWGVKAAAVATVQRKAIQRIRGNANHEQGEPARSQVLTVQPRQAPNVKSDPYPGRRLAPPADPQHRTG